MPSHRRPSQPIPQSLAPGNAFRTEYFGPVAVAGNDLGVPLLRTKLVVPSSPRLVVRESLIDGLSEGLSRPLTLVYGPAGSGKTMLVAQWGASAREERPVAWLSLEADDNDPARFWMYVIEALRSVLPGIGEASVAMLRAPGVNLVEEALPALINELADVSDQFVVVLDDYHAIDDERIHEGVASLIEHLPATLRIVMTSRVEPPIRVATLRARAQLNEIDAGQLRFSLSEAESMLNDVHGLDLTPDAVERLHDRTEGWAAGLYLAVLSLRGREDASGLVASFTGSDRRVVDYLAVEVLGEQREEELDFLLHTSVLDRFCAALCDAVRGAQDSRAMLDRIERMNYFLIPLDPSHEWYRYHHLFGELLRHELGRREPRRAAELDDRAGRWFLDAGMVSEAIGHLTAAGELDAASELIDNHWLAFTNAGQRETVARWMDQLPRGYIASDGRLCLAQVLDGRQLPESFSISYGICENDVRGNGPDVTPSTRAGANLLDSLLILLGLAGVGAYASGGDSGSSCNGLPYSGVAWPASSPYLTAVGGTRLALTPSNQRLDEVVWNDLKWTPASDGGGAGGGGFSLKSARPPFQLGLGLAGNRRAVPDVSAAASSFPGWPVVLGGHWTVDAGTSAATPLVAAAMAVVSADLQRQHLPPVGPADVSSTTWPGADPAHYGMLSRETTDSSGLFQPAMPSPGMTSPAGWACPSSRRSRN